MFKNFVTLKSNVLLIGNEKQILKNPDNGLKFNKINIFYIVIIFRERLRTHKAVGKLSFGDDKVNRFNFSKLQNLLLELNDTILHVAIIIPKHACTCEASEQFWELVFRVF